MSTLDCNEFVELVTEFLERSLDAGTQRRVVDHLALCEGCQQYLDQFRRTIHVVGELQPEPPPSERLPDDARADLLAAFRDRRR